MFFFQTIILLRGTSVVTDFTFAYAVQCLSVVFEYASVGKIR